MDCIFCKIINGEIPSYTVYEDDVVKAFLDINPDVNGHVLIVSKEHFLDIMELPNNVLLHIIEITKVLKKRLEEKLGIDGLTLIQNNGAIQDVKHFHLHLKPYYKVEQKKMDLEEVYSIMKEQ